MRRRSGRRPTGSGTTHRTSHGVGGAVAGGVVFFALHGPCALLSAICFRRCGVGLDDQTEHRVGLGRQVRKERRVGRLSDLTEEGGDGMSSGGHWTMPFAGPILREVTANKSREL